MNGPYTVSVAYKGMVCRDGKRFITCDGSIQALELVDHLNDYERKIDKLQAVVDAAKICQEEFRELNLNPDFGFDKARGELFDALDALNPKPKEQLLNERLAAADALIVATNRNISGEDFLKIQTAAIEAKNAHEAAS